MLIAIVLVVIIIAAFIYYKYYAPTIPNIIASAVKAKEKVFAQIKNSRMQLQYLQEFLPVAVAAQKKAREESATSTSTEANAQTEDVGFLIQKYIDTTRRDMELLGSTDIALNRVIKTLTEIESYNGVISTAISDAAIVAKAITEVNAAIASLDGMSGFVASAIDETELTETLTKMLEMAYAVDEIKNITSSDVYKRLESSQQAMQENYIKANAMAMTCAKDLAACRASQANSVSSEKYNALLSANNALVARYRTESEAAQTAAAQCAENTARLNATNASLRTAQENAVAASASAAATAAANLRSMQATLDGINRENVSLKSQVADSVARAKVASDTANAALAALQTRYDNDTRAAATQIARLQSSLDALSASSAKAASDATAAYNALAANCNNRNISTQALAALQSKYDALESSSAKAAADAAAAFRALKSTTDAAANAATATIADLNNRVNALNAQITTLNASLTDSRKTLDDTRSACQATMRDLQAKYDEAVKNARSAQLTPAPAPVQAAALRALQDQVVALTAQISSQEDLIKKSAAEIDNLTSMVVQLVGPIGDGQTLRLSCPTGQKIRVRAANYGGGSCPNVNRAPAISKRCDNEQNCSFTTPIIPRTCKEAQFTSVAFQCEAA